MRRLSGKIDQSTVTSNLMSVAGEILNKAPDSDMNKKDVAASLQEQIETKLGV